MKSVSESLWTACADALPKEEGVYIVYVDGGKPHRFVTIGAFYSLKDGWTSHCGTVTHWQPWPDPPLAAGEREGCCDAMVSWIAAGRVTKHYHGILSIFPGDIFGKCDIGWFLSFCPFCGKKLPWKNSEEEAND